MVFWVVRAANKQLVRNWRHLHGLLRQTVKQLAARGRIPAIEAKGELIQIVVQMLRRNGTLVGSQQPALEQGCHPMHPWQQFCCGTFLLAFELADLVLIAQLLQPLIRFPTVCMNTTPLNNRTLDKRMELDCRGIWNSSQTDASNAGTRLLGRDHHQRLARSTPSFPSRRRSTHLGFVHFDSTAEFVPAGSHHGPAQLVQNRPRCLIAAQAQDALQPQGAGPVLLTGHLPNCHGTKAAMANGYLGRWCRRSRWLGDDRRRISVSLVVPAKLFVRHSLGRQIHPANGVPLGKRGTVLRWQNAVPFPKSCSDSPRSSLSTTPWGWWSQ